MFDIETFIEKNIVQYIIEHRGFKYPNINDKGLVLSVWKDYHFADIRSDDVVLDIGANLGAFSIMVSNKAKRVWAVEPLFYSELGRNLYSNNVRDYMIQPCALGRAGQQVELEYHNRRNKVPCKALFQLITDCRRVDFLKLDAEGGEYCISPWEIKGIRRIEAELHPFDIHGNKRNMGDFLRVLEQAKFTFDINVDGEFWLVHAYSEEI